VRENNLESGYLRPLTWIGSEKLGVSPKGNTIHLMVAAWAWGAYLGEEGLRRGIRVKTSSYTRHHVNITMTQAKAVSNYTNSILANTEAVDDGYDEALLLDASGFVSEGAGENIFVIKNGVVYTPDLSAGALNGITRNTVFAICQDLGLKVVEKRITRDEVYIADEAFFTGTAAEVTPIRELDRVEIGIGRRGPVTEKIQNAFFDIVNGRKHVEAGIRAPGIVEGNGPRIASNYFDLAMLMELAAWRESEAQARDVPRARVLKDEVLIELALAAPRDPGMTAGAASACDAASRRYRERRSNPRTRAAWLLLPATAWSTRRM